MPYAVLAEHCRPELSTRTVVASEMQGSLSVSGFNVELDTACKLLDNAGSLHCKRFKRIMHALKQSISLMCTVQSARSDGAISVPVTYKTW